MKVYSNSKNLRTTKTKLPIILQVRIKNHLFSSALNDICLEVTLSELAILTSLFNLIDRLVFTAPVFPGSIDFSFFLVLVVFDVALIC